MTKKILLLLISTNLMAQNPPPPPAADPLIAPTDPVGNISTADKILLGKALFWDEQMSSSKTVACASCHIMSSAGTDPRSTENNAAALNPGFDGLFQTVDDIIGSPGVAESCEKGDYTLNQDYGYNPQVTGRKAPSVINAGYSDSLFWDGRAEDQLIDPVTNETVLTSGAALETQILGPPTSSVEMGHTGRTWQDTIESIEKASPLALTPLLSTEMETWIGNQSYYQLFDRVYGSSEITASKIAMAIAAYERSLYSNQTSFDENLNGNPNAMNQQEREGLRVFRDALCGGCHTTGLLTNHAFHNIGVTTNAEDPGRFEVTNRNADRGRFKTPALRNLNLRTSFMHNGGFSTLEQVVDFYDRGGDVNNPNLDPRMVPLNLTQTQKNNLVYFLRNSLSDQRVEDETGPFGSPLLYSESDRVPTISGTGVVGSNNKTPKLTAIQPPIMGNTSFTVAVENAKAGSQSTFVISNQDPGVSAIPQQANSLIFASKTLITANNGDGHASLSVELPSDTTLNGTTLYGRWYIQDEQGIDGLAVSELLQFTLFKPEYGQAGKIFSGAFETSTSNCD